MASNMAGEIGTRADLAELVDRLVAEGQDAVTVVRRFRARPPSLVPIPEGVDPRLVDALRVHGIARRPAFHPAFKGAPRLMGCW